MIDNYTMGMCICPGTQAIQDSAYLNGLLVGAGVVIMIVVIVTILDFIRSW